MIASPLRRPRALLLAAAFLLPWVIAIGSAHVLEQWFPGQVRVDHWRHLSSLGFVLGGVAAVVLILRSFSRLPGRALVAVVALAGSLWLALMFQLRSNCGDESPYVGPHAGAETASCE